MMPSFVLVVYVPRRLLKLPESHYADHLKIFAIVHTVTTCERRKSTLLKF